MTYQDYKESNIAWIGKIPTHWEIHRLKNLCSLKARIGWKGLRSDEFEEESYAYLVTGQDFKKADIDWGSCYQINKERYDEDPYIQLNNGDLLITKDGTIGKIAKVSNLDKPACLNSGVFVLKQKAGKFDQGYLYWSLVSNLLGDFNNYTSTGTTILHLYQNVFENMPLILPPFEEQVRIALYLDKKCDKINSAIDIQKRKIELLNELKQTIITNAVTKGLNPDAPMKDSGVEWIGEVPMHWEVMRLKRCSSIKTGCTPPTNESKYYDSEDIDWYTPTDIGGNRLSEADKKISSSCKTDGVCRLFPKKTIYFVGIGATIGKVSYCEEEASSNQQINAIMPNERADYKFLTYVLKSQKEEIYLTANTVTLPIINQDRTGSLFCPIPTISEQNEIVQFIENEIEKIDIQISKANRRIELLNELKQSIITEAVTGKVKVC